MEHEQMDLLWEIDEQERQRAQLTEWKIEREYERVTAGQIVNGEVPIGAEVIVRSARWKGPVHWYRTIIGEHGTVRGPAREVRSEPNGEWPEEPPWQGGLDGKRYIYPSWDYSYFVRKGET